MSKDKATETASATDTRTRIDGIATDEDGYPRYDVAGRLITSPVNGVFIQNRRKKIKK